MRSALRLLTASFLAASLVACGGGGGSAGGPGGTVPGAPSTPTATPLPIPSGATDTVAVALTASSGGTVALTSGSSIGFSPNALNADAVVQAADIPNASLPPTTTNFTSLAPALQIALYPAGSPTVQGRRERALPYQAMGNKRMDTSAPGITVQFKVPADVQSTIENDGSGFVIPVLKIYSGTNASAFTYVASPMQFDPSTGIVTAILQGPLNIGQLVQIFIEELGGSQVQCQSPGRFQPGLRYYDPNAKQWTTGAPPSVPVHPLILLHGVLSCVESTFNPGLVEQIREDGGYDAVYGYDYDWLKLPSDVVPDMDAVFSGLGFQHVDVMAHSYGTVMAMAMIPGLDTQTVDNLVLIEGPLNGSLLDDPNLLMSTVAVWPNAVGLAEGAAFKIGSTFFPVTSIFVPGNSTLQNIESAMMSASDAPSHVIKVAGNIPLAHMADIYQAIYHQPIPAGDGVMSVDSELYSGVAGSQSTYQYARVDAATPTATYAADHTSLLGLAANAQALEEKTIAPNLAFELNNADPNTGYYPSSGAQIILKGIGTRSYIGFIDGNTGSTVNSHQTIGDFLNITPDPQETEPYQNAGPYQEYQVTANPTANLDDSPNDVVATDLNDAIDGLTPNEYTENLFILPSCSSCNTANASVLRRVNSLRLMRTRSTRGLSRLNAPLPPPRR